MTSQENELKPTKFLITGGSGFLGINLIRFLLERGHSVTSIDFAEFDYPEKDKINIFLDDIRNKDRVDAAMEGNEIVIHCAAALPLYSKEDIFTTDIDGTRNVFQSAFEHGIKRGVHISTTAVYGVPDHHPLYEHDPKIGVGPYGEAKVRAEDVIDEFRKQDMCISILRPKSFIGPERLGVFAMFYEWAKDGKNFPLLGNGKNKYQFLDVEDLCNAIYLSVTGDPEKCNDVFNVGAEEFTTMREDFQAVLDEAGHGKRMIPFPASPLIWTLRVLEFFKLSPLYKWIYETACTDSFVAIDKAKEVLGYRPKYSNKDALLRNYKWYLDNLSKFKATSGISHRAPWKQGALSLAKFFF